jgi:hypothetical protein
MARHKNSADHEISEILQNAESASESSEDDIKQNYESTDDFEESDDLSMRSANISNSSDEDSSPPPKRKIPPPERKWKEGNFIPKIEPFTITHSGILNNLLNISLETPLDFFELFFDSSLVENIVTQTNIYQNQNNSTAAAKTAPWIDTNIPEMYVFFATRVLMSYTKKNRIKDFWSTDNLISTPIFGPPIILFQHRFSVDYLHGTDIYPF